MSPLKVHISVPGGKDREFTSGSTPMRKTDPVTGITIEYGGDSAGWWRVLNRDGTIAGGGLLEHGLPQFCDANVKNVPSVEAGQPGTKMCNLVRGERIR